MAKQKQEDEQLNPIELLYQHAEKHKGCTRWPRFAEEYVIDHNGAAAARRAKYSEKAARRQAHKLLHIPIIKDAIDYLNKEISAAANITAESVRFELEQTRRLAITQGNLQVAKECTVWKGKTIGAFTDRIDTTIKHEDLSDDELDELIRKYTEQVAKAGAGATASGEAEEEEPE